MSLSEFVNLCHTVGSRVPVWNQGVGGNVSLKFMDGDGETMLVKSSGYRLDGVGMDQGISHVDLAAFRGEIGQLEALSGGGETRYAEALDNHVRKGGRPSMETGIHAILPAKWVVHFHSLAAVLMWHANDSQVDEFSSWVRGNCPWPLVFIEAIRPGWELTQRLRRTPDFPACVIQCHGVVLQLDNTRQIGEWLDIEQRFCRDWGHDRLGALLKGDKPLDVTEFARWSPAPMRLFFPDSAVFYDRLVGVLQPEDRQGAETRYGLAQGALDTDPDVSEIWLATQILYESCPTLAELEGELAHGISGLPAERYRRNMGLQAKGGRP